ncbi:unnamed protein product [Phytomonas sp. EM1]|nr:unnamed protein product [Phytomonas sp. EM1]|eukprot:CCW60007.1 unnamed protein product [Phytomonas sp. isolate EM1]
MPSPKDFMPPANWRKLFDQLVQYRATLAAPVDTVGCDCLYDRKASKETKRFQILVALMLSSQTKDHITAAAMENLMQHNLTPQGVMRMPLDQFDECIQKVSFHNNKAKYIKAAAEIIVMRHGGNVPNIYEELIELPGVGPKMAHLFFQSADQKVFGIGVDTHVHRISKRFGWTPASCKTPEETRKVLESWLPRDLWDQVNKLLVGLGQTVCRAVNPCCSECMLNKTCPNAFRETQGGKRERDKTPVKGKVSDIEDQIKSTKTAPKKQFRKKISTIEVVAKKKAKSM